MSHDTQRRRLKRLAWLLDDSITIPIINRRIGLDSVIGLVPVVGDIAGGAVSTYILVSAARMGAPFVTLMHILFNLGLEVVLGAVPLLGDLFDMGFKANRRNVGLIEAHLDRPGVADRHSRLFIWGLAAAVFVVFVGVAWLAVWLVYSGLRALFGYAG